MACNQERMMNLPIRDEYKQTLMQFCSVPENAEACQELCGMSDEQIVHTFEATENQLTDWAKNGAPDEITQGLAQQTPGEGAPDARMLRQAPELEQRAMQNHQVGQGIGSLGPTTKPVPPGVAPSDLSRVPMPMDMPRQGYAYGGHVRKFGLGGFLDDVGDFISDNAGAIIGGVVGFTLGGPLLGAEWGAALGASAGSYAQHGDTKTALLAGLSGYALGSLAAPTGAEGTVSGSATGGGPGGGVPPTPGVTPTGAVVADPSLTSGSITNAASTGPQLGQVYGTPYAGPGPVVPADMAAIAPPPSATAARPMVGPPTPTPTPAPAPAPSFLPPGGEVAGANINYGLTPPAGTDPNWLAGGQPDALGLGTNTISNSTPLTPMEKGWAWVKDNGPTLAGIGVLAGMAEKPEYPEAPTPQPSEYSLYQQCLASGRTDCTPPAGLFPTNRRNHTFGRTPTQIRGTQGITALRNNGGSVHGPGTEKSDSIPAYLSNNEFVMTADAVRGAGNGNLRDGIGKMYWLMDQLEQRGKA